MNNGVKVGFFSKIVDLINMLYPFKKEEVPQRKSRFEGFLKQGEKEKSLKVVSAVKLADEALDIVSDRVVLINRLKSVEERMEEVESYGRLTNEDVEDLKDLLARYSSLAKDSNALKYQVTSFDANLVRMEKLGEAAEKDMPEIKYAEERQRIFKQDISYLEGEKMVLEHASERLKNAIDFVYKFSIAMVFFFGGLSLVMIFLYIFRNVQTMPVISAMLVFVIIIAGLLYALRNRLKYELALNYKKQSRAIELLNKKVVVYAHFTNYLNYEYRKFKVRNSEMLANNLHDYSNYRHLTKRLDSLRNIMAQTEDAIDFFLKDKGIALRFSSIEKFAGTVNVDDKKRFYEELFREKSLIEKSLKRLDARNSQIWDELMELKVSGGKDIETIDHIIEQYVEKAEKTMTVDALENIAIMDELDGDDEGKIFEFTPE